MFRLRKSTSSTIQQTSSRHVHSVLLTGVNTTLFWHCRGNAPSPPGYPHFSSVAFMGTMPLRPVTDRCCLVNRSVIAESGLTYKPCVLRQDTHAALLAKDNLNCVRYKIKSLQQCICKQHFFTVCLHSAQSNSHTVDLTCCRNNLACSWQSLFQQNLYHSCRGVDGYRCCWSTSEQGRDRTGICMGNWNTLV